MYQLRRTGHALKGDKQLREENFGLNLSKLADKSEVTEWVRLRRVLKDSQKQLENSVESGCFPLFGYPPMILSRRDETPIAERVAKCILSKNQDIVTIPDIVQAQDRQDEKDELV